MGFVVLGQVISLENIEERDSNAHDKGKQAADKAPEFGFSGPSSKGKGERRIDFVGTIQRGR